MEISDKEFVGSFEKMVLSLEEPIADPACLNLMLISQLAKQKGISVLLSGAGGDDIFSGYRRHQGIFLDKKIRFLRVLLSYFGKENGLKLLTRLKLPKYLIKYLNGINLKGDERLFNYFHWSNKKESSDLFKECFSKKLINIDVDLDFINYLASDKNLDEDDLEKVLKLEQRFFLGEHNLVYNDKMSMSQGVEVRVPFLDNDLVKLVNTIPSSLKVRHFKPKYILKKAMEPILPHDIIYRKKRGFGLPINRWTTGIMKEFILDTLSTKNLKTLNFFNLKKIEILKSSHFKNQQDHSYLLLSLCCSVVLMMKNAKI